jgi:hypothetical protein
MLKNTIQGLVAAILIMGMAVPPTGSARELTGEVEVLPASSGLYRSRVAVHGPTDWARLEKLGVVVETTADGRPPTAVDKPAAVGGPWSAVVLADDAHLEALARLRFEPRGTDELGGLVAAHAVAKPWLARSLRPLLSQAAALQAEVERSRGAGERGRQPLRNLRLPGRSCAPRCAP